MKAINLQLIKRKWIMDFKVEHWNDYTVWTHIDDNQLTQALLILEQTNKPSLKIGNEHGNYYLIYQRPARPMNDAELQLCNSITARIKI